MAYGFQINVDGNSIQVLKQIEAEIAKLASQVAGATKQMSSGFDQFKHSLGEIGGMVAGAFAVDRIIEFGKELLHTTAEFEGFENVIKYSSTGILDASSNFDYIKDAIDRLHLPMRETMESFSEMQAGFYGTGIEGEKMRKVFEGVAEASSVLHLNPATFSRVTFALKEIGELGTLQARQLRMLAFSLPGSVNLAAQALGMTMEKLHEGMKKGEIKSSDFLPKFAEKLKVHFEPGLANAGNSLISQMNDQKTAITKMLLEVGESLRPLFMDIMKDIIAGANTIKEIWGSLTGDSEFVETLRSLLAIMLKLVPIWVAYRGYLLAVSLITKVFTIENGALILSIGELGIATDGTNFAMKGFFATLSSGVMMGAVIGLGLIIEKFIEINSELDAAANKFSNISQIRGLTDQLKTNSTSINSQFGNLGSLDKSQKQELAFDIQEEIKKIQGQLAKTVSPQIDVTKAEYDKNHDAASKLSSNPFDVASMGAKYGLNRAATDLKDNLTENKESVETFKNTISDLQVKLAMLKNQGIKPKALTFASAEGHDGAKDGALNTSALSGAKGGLGEAKVINIHIDTVQKNVGVKASDLPKESETALDYLIRTVNNLAYSQGSM